MNDELLKGLGLSLEGHIKAVDAVIAEQERLLALQRRSHETEVGALQSRIAELERDRERLDKAEAVLKMDGWEVVVISESVICAAMDGYEPKKREVVASTLRNALDAFELRESE